MNKIQLVVFDFDGVFTDGKIYVSKDGNEMKYYNGKDSYGLKLLQSVGIKTGLITADNSDIVSKMRHIYPRMDKICCGKYEKLPVLNQWRKDLELEWCNIAYMGDDLPDMECLNHVGFSGCPNNAINRIKDICKYVCDKDGGDGAVREFVDQIIVYKLEK